MSLYKTLKRTGEYTYKTTLNTKESVGTSDPTHKAMKALITRKIGMTSTIAQDGTVQAVTLLSASPCVITQVKTDETDGYTAVQIGFEEAKETAVSKPQQGHFKAAKVLPKIVREFRVPEITEDLKVGETSTQRSFQLATLYT
jgi:large subunit ribosomal protein L3